MKKYLSLLILTALILLSSCVARGSQTDKRTDVSSSFESIDASFSAAFGELETKGEFTFTPERLTLSFVSPETVRGLSLASDGDSVFIEYGGVKMQKDVSALNNYLNADIIFLLLKNAMQADATKENGYMIFRGDGGEIYFDGENRVSRITVPEKKIDIKLEW